MEINYKAKIKKLLALAESPVEAEAQAALLKAREMMAKHKLSERDLKDAGNQEVKDIELEITCSKRRDPWIVNLSGVIAENYCCKGYRRHSHGSQTQRMGFIGFEDDVEICVAVFKYAVDCVLARIKEIRKEYKLLGLGADSIKKMCDSYGYGFVNGTNKAFKEQQEEKQQEWGLVLVTPKEVQEASAHWKQRAFKARAARAENLHMSAFQSGYADGKRFDPKHRLKTGS